MHTQVSVPTQHSLHSAPRSNSLFERRLNVAYRIQWASEEAAVRDVAVQAVGFFRRAEAALSPIIGAQSVGALYQRSLHLTRSEHPWLAIGCGEWMQTDPLVLLENTVTRQTLGSASAAVQALLSAFRQLLSTLIGTSLTAQLLRDPAS